MKTIRFHDNKNTISQKVRTAREGLNMSQEDLARQLQTYGISIDQQAIRKIERNLRIVTEYEFACLCKALKVDEKWMLSYCYDLMG